MRSVSRLVALLALGLGSILAAQVNPPVAPNVPPPLSKTPSIFGTNWEVSLAGTYSMARATVANGNRVSTTNVPGIQVGLRYHATDTSAIDFRVGVSEPLQTYGPTLRAKSYAFEYAFEYVWTYPTEGKVRPYLLGGPSVIRYATIPGPETTTGAQTQKQWAISYGAGLDFKLSPAWSIRAEYRGLFYKVPDFGLIGIDRWNHMPQPSLALVYHF